MHYFMFNKPRGCVTARKDELHKTVMDYFPDELRNLLHPVGRLDIDTEGLLLITDDGMFDHRLMLPDFHVEKRYFFYAFGSPDSTDIHKLESGVMLKGQDKPTLPAKFELCERMTVADIEVFLPDSKRERFMKNPCGKIFSGYITLTEGRNHQVKRMLKAVGCTVAYLKRVSIGGVVLDADLKSGEYRPLTDTEYHILYNRTDLPLNSKASI